MINDKHSNLSGYQQAFASYLGPDVSAFAFWKGRVALFAILKALGISPGDEVVLPGFTCVVVPNAVRFAGAHPVFVDNAPGSFNIDPAQIESAITPHTRAIMIQHNFDIPAQIDEVRRIADAHGLFLIEDACHSMGSTYHGRALGTWGDAAFFSSQWSKPFTTGLGGIAVTRDLQLAHKIALVQKEFLDPPFEAKTKLFLQFFIFKKFFSPSNYWTAQGLLRTLSKLGLFVGSSNPSELKGEMPQDHNWRMSDSQAKAGIIALSKMKKRILQRQSLQSFYEAGLQENHWPKVNRSCETVLLLYPIEVANKVELLEKAREHHIELGSWFETPLHPIPLQDHIHFGYRLGQCPNAEQSARQVVNLPMNAWMTIPEAEKTLSFFFKFAKHPE